MKRRSKYSTPRIDMRIILKKDVLDIGVKGDIKDVSAGFARNHLIPNGLAYIAKEVSVERLMKEKDEKKDKTLRDHENIDNKIGLLNEKTISIKVKTDKGGHLYKKLHAKEIADAIKINWNIKQAASR